MCLCFVSGGFCAAETDVMMVQTLVNINDKSVSCQKKKSVPGPWTFLMAFKSFYFYVYKYECNVIITIFYII